MVDADEGPSRFGLLRSFFFSFLQAVWHPAMFHDAGRFQFPTATSYKASNTPAGRRLISTPPKYPRTYCIRTYSYRLPKASCRHSEFLACPCFGLESGPSTTGLLKLLNRLATDHPSCRGPWASTRPLAKLKTYHNHMVLHWGGRVMAQAGMRPYRPPPH